MNFKELFVQMKLVLKGKKLYSHFTSKYELDKSMDWVIILPEEDIKTNMYFLLYLNLLVKQFEEEKDKLYKLGYHVIRENEKFLILISDKCLADNAEVLFPRTNYIEIIEKESMEAIKARYSFMPFNERTVIGTVKAINGSDYTGLVQSNQLCLAEIIAVSIIGIKRINYMKWSIPKIQVNRLNSEEMRIICREIYAEG